MVAQVLTLENRAQRQKAAERVVRVMANMFPQNKNVPDFRHKLWDHLALMADYRLDIDYPYGRPMPKPADARPARIAYPSHRIGFRHYGKILEAFVEHLNHLPEGEEKQQLARLVAGQMKHSLAEWNKDSMSNDKVVLIWPVIRTARCSLTPPCSKGAASTRQVMQPASCVRCVASGAAVPDGRTVAPLFIIS
mgnify:CR=1 FL=1